MFKVELKDYNGLPDDYKGIVPNNGHGKEYANYIVLSDSGDIKIVLSDAVEPEDATFNRDFKDVIFAIKMAYKIGIGAGRKLPKKKENTD